jgi:hypothetical protein
MTEDWVEEAAATTFADSPPADVERGVVLVGAPETAVAGDVCLQVGIGRAVNPTCIVATRVPPGRLEEYVSDRAPTRPALGFVDATPHRPTPAVKERVQAIEDVPGASDLLQVTTAVNDVCGAVAPTDQPTNVVVPVVDSLLGVAPTERVVRVLAQVAESADDEGRVVVGIDYTAGSRDTLRALKDHSDAMLWAERNPAGEVALDFEPLRA